MMQYQNQGSPERRSVPAEITWCINTIFENRSAYLLYKSEALPDISSFTTREEFKTWVNLDLKGFPAGTKLVHYLAATLASNSLDENIYNIFGALKYLKADFDAIVKIIAPGSDGAYRSEFTPAMIASLMDNFDALNAISECGANLDFRNNDGLTAEEIAVALECHGCAALLDLHRASGRNSEFKSAPTLKVDFDERHAIIKMIQLFGPFPYLHEGSLNHLPVSQRYQSDMIERLRLASQGSYGEQQKHELAITLLTSNYPLWIKQFAVRLGLDPNMEISNNLTIAGHALKNNKPVLFHHACEIGCTRFYAKNPVQQYVTPGENPKFITEEELFTNSKNLLTALSINYLLDITKDTTYEVSGKGAHAPFSELSNLFSKTSSPSLLYSTLLACDELLHNDIGTKGGAFRTMSLALLNLPEALRPGITIGSGIRRAYEENNGDISAIEPEVLLLLNNPKDRTFANPRENRIFQHLPIFSPEEHVEILRERHWALSRIGVISSSFAFHRYDAKKIQILNHEGKNLWEMPSLFEAFEAQRLLPETSCEEGLKIRKESEKFGARYYFHTAVDLTDMHYGTSYYLTWEIKARGFEALIDDTHALYIRNSAPEYGRDLMEETFYFLNRMNYDIEDLANPTPEMLKEALTLKDFKEIDFTHINLLLDKRIALENKYTKYIFDTNFASAWEGSYNGKVLTGGYHSPGFNYFRKALEYFVKEAKESGEVRRLAFFQPDLPPLTPYAFEDAEGNKLMTLIVDEGVIQDLKYLSNLEIGEDPDRLRKSVNNFLQVGFSKQARLTIL